LFSADDVFCACSADDESESEELELDDSGLLVTLAFVGFPLLPCVGVAAAAGVNCNLCDTEDFFGAASSESESEELELDDLLWANGVLLTMGFPDFPTLSSLGVDLLAGVDCGLCDATGVFCVSSSESEPEELELDDAGFFCVNVALRLCLGVGRLILDVVAGTFLLLSSEESSDDDESFFLLATFGVIFGSLAGCTTAAALGVVTFANGGTSSSEELSLELESFLFDILAAAVGNPLDAMAVLPTGTAF